MHAEALTKKEKEELIDLIKEKCIRKGSFKLASGGTSSFFFDMKKATLEPTASKLISKAMLALISEEDVKYVGGLESGAIPIVSQLCVESSPEKPLQGFFVRKTGDERNPQIEGNLADGAKVILVEDVTTKGSSALAAAKAVKNKGCRADKVITIVDRLEGAKENLKKENIELIALFDQKDFADEIKT
ncbi:MAG: orotate phosphoribosyltransferase [Candidatus Altiarchaeota archaeon]|nr:orotate phosphoribosyltransferase [Candidatus Altiarchaeota archaeon]